MVLFQNTFYSRVS